MKLLKWMWLIGAVLLLIGDAFIITNAAADNIIPAPIVATAVVLGVVTLFCGLVYFRPKKQ